MQCNAAINKCSNTYYGKGFPNTRKYENMPGKYFPGAHNFEMSVASRFQTSDNNFFTGKTNALGAGPKNFYTTSQNFSGGMKKNFEVSEYGHHHLGSGG